MTEQERKLWTKLYNRAALAVVLMFGRRGGRDGYVVMCRWSMWAKRRFKLNVW